MTNMYIKYDLNYTLIMDLLEKNKKKKVNIFIDVQSICKGFYNRDIIAFEIGEYITNNKLSNVLIEEMRLYLNKLYKIFKKWDPFFILFYDNGFCQQNKTIMNSYKSGRSINNLMLPEEQDIELYRAIKRRYFGIMETEFTKDDLSHVFYLKNNESDFIPHYCLMNDLYEANDKETLNIILSVDKDLLQTTKYSNTVQCITSFKADKTTGKYKIDFGIFDKKNAISYIYKQFKPGILTAEHIPLVLSLCGDKSDNVPGITGIGPAKAIKLISENNIPSNISLLKDKLQTMPKIVQDNIEIVIRNLKLIDFEEQLKRVGTILV